MRGLYKATCPAVGIGDQEKRLKLHVLKMNFVIAICLFSLWTCIGTLGKTFLFSFFVYNVII